MRSKQKATKGIDLRIGRKMALLLAVVLTMQMLMPVGVFSASLITQPNPNLPQPGEALHDPEVLETTGWGSLTMDGYDGARRIVMTRPERLVEVDRFEFVIAGDTLEFYGLAVITYDTGRQSQPYDVVHEVFADGERITLFVDHSLGTLAEAYVQFRSVVGTVDTRLYNFPVRYDGRRITPATQPLFPSDMSVTSPNQRTRKVGSGSVMDVMTFATEGRAPSYTISATRPDVPSTNTDTPINPSSSDSIYTPPTTTPNLTPLIAPATTNHFTDVPIDHWARESIYAAAERGLMRGTAEGIFSPEGMLTRAQVAQILFNAYREELPASRDVNYSDVSPSAWYARAMSWAGYHDIWPRGPGSIEAGGVADPNEPATREMVAAMLYLTSHRLFVAVPPTYPEVHFPDNTNPWTNGPITALQRAGVLGGFPDGSFRPHETITRAQMASIMIRYTNLPGLAP